MSTYTRIFNVYDASGNGNIIATTTDAELANSWGNTNEVMLVDTYNTVATTYTITYYNNNSVILTQSINGTMQRIYRKVFDAYGYNSDTGTIYNLKLGNTYIYSNTTFTLQNYSLTGYYNLKWNTKSDLSGTNYNLNEQYTTNLSVNFYLNKTANTYSITYVKNGGTTTGTDPATATYDAPFTLPTISKTNYTFNGWYWWNK